jgi:hypothetical protein
MLLLSNSKKEVHSSMSSGNIVTTFLSTLVLFIQSRGLWGNHSPA